MFLLALTITEKLPSDKPDLYALPLRQEIRADYEQYAEDLGFPIRPQKLIYDLRRVLGDDDILISDMGAHKMWIARHYHCRGIG